MNLEESFRHREGSLLSKLKGMQTGIDDSTGKGMATEMIVEEGLLRPFLPPGFDCGKGAVISAEEPMEQSPAIDRVIFDRRACTPLVYDQSHSIFPIEAVAGMVEITMCLDAKKLQTDIERMVAVKGMKVRQYVLPKPGSRTKGFRYKEKDSISARSFIVGLPTDHNWNAPTIASTLRQIQMQLGPPTHVHGLYVIGIGFFVTIPVENEKTDPMYRIAAWTGPERIFRFADEFRRAFDRWPALQEGGSVDLCGYVPGERKVLAE